MVFVALATNFAVAQSVTLRFTSSMGGAYVPLSYVEVENLSRNWVECSTVLWVTKFRCSYSKGRLLEHISKSDSKGQSYVKWQ